MTKKFSKLFIRKGKIKGNIIKIDFKRDAKVTQQNGHRVPLHQQTAVEAEMAKLFKEGHVRRIDKTYDEVFIQRTVTTIKRDKTVKVALDARHLNNAIQKDKRQMPNLDNLMEQVAEIMKSTSEKSVRFTSLDLNTNMGKRSCTQTPQNTASFKSSEGKRREHIHLIQEFTA